MYNSSLHIKLIDWFNILIVSLLFSMFMSSLAYLLFGHPWSDGAYFGIIIGGSITLFAFILTSYANKHILPKVKEIYWLPLSMLFSFAAGLLGTLLGVFVATFFHISLIPAFKEQIAIISILIGILTYLMGALLYRFVKIRNQKDVVDDQYVQSRLRSLETQLNPHFLFNALNSIAELIHQDKDKAEMALLKISSFLRNTMDEKALIPIKEEVKNAIDYVELENIRFSDKIKLHIDDEIPAWQTPKFSLQLIVENAIKHGFSPDAKELNIYVNFDPKRKLIVIQNDGKEMQNKDFGVGLSNLKQRLELLCKGSLSVGELESSMFYIYLGACCENFNR